VHPGFCAVTGNLKELTAEQVRALREELVRAERSRTLRKALTIVREVRDSIGRKSETVTRTESMGSPAPAGIDSAAAAAAPNSAAAGAVPSSAAAAPDAAPVAPLVAEEAAESTMPPAPRRQDSTWPAAAPYSAGKSEEGAAIDQAEQAGQTPLADEAERNWRKQLAESLRELRRSEHVSAALKVAAPALLEPSDEALLSLTADHLRRLHDELVRLQEEVDKGGSKPRALVRAMQMLYLADGIEDSSLSSLSAETADEEALRQLTERTEEFAPALDALRHLAVDHDIFEHLKDKVDEDGADGLRSESEGSDVAKELLGSKEPTPVVLPPGWRLEWIKRKKREVKEFLDPNGQRYYTVKDVRAAIDQWNRAAEAAALEEAAKGAASHPAAPPPKRVRIRAKTSDEGYYSQQQPPAQFAVAEDLLSATFVDDFQAEFEKELEGALLSAGVRITLCALVAKPELNGQGGVLQCFNEGTGRWECKLDDGSVVNVKPANVEVQLARVDLLMDG